MVGSWFRRRRGRIRRRGEEGGDLKGEGGEQMEKE
jgi:hypothetical protein